MRKNVLILFVALIVVLVAESRPREDLVDFSKMSGGTKKKKTILLDKDITFTSEDLEKRMDDPTVKQVRFNVVGRSKPDRLGKKLEKFPKGALAKLLFLSKNERWVAVESVRSQKKSWLPRSAFPSFKEEILKKKKEE